MNKRYCVVALLVCLVLLVSACKKSGAATGGAPRTPFIGGTAGITMNFEKGNPPEEVTDDESFAFNTIIRLKNEGEFPVHKDNIRVNLVGFDPADFGKNFDDLKNVVPEDTLDAKRKDAEGNIVEGTTTFATFPKTRGDFFTPTKFPGNTEFTFRADACYFYATQSNTKLCVLKDMINTNEESLCRPNGGRITYSSSAPVQVSNFRQSVVGKNKISFSFDVALSGNVDIFWKKDDGTPNIKTGDFRHQISDFDVACPRAPQQRREMESRVAVEITEIPDDPIFQNLKCGGLGDTSKGTVILVNGIRTITCTVELVDNRLDLEKVVGVNLFYNVLDIKEQRVLIKHLASESSNIIG